MRAPQAVSEYPRDFRLARKARPLIEFRTVARHGCEYFEVAARAQSNDRILGHAARVHAAKDWRNSGEILKLAATPFKVVTDPDDVIKRLIHGVPSAILRRRAGPTSR